MAALRQPLMAGGMRGCARHGWLVVAAMLCEACTSRLIGERDSAGETDGVGGQRSGGDACLFGSVYDTWVFEGDCLVTQDNGDTSIAAIGACIRHAPDECYACASERDCTAFLTEYDEKWDLSCIDSLYTSELRAFA
jgi:hypothetical protein